MKLRNARREQLGRTSKRTALLATVAGLAVAVSGCGKDNSSVHDLVLSCSDKSKTPKSFAIVNLNDNTKVKGMRSHRTNIPFNTSKARDSFPEDRSLSAAAILYSCAPRANQTKPEGKKGPNPPESMSNPEFVAPHDRSVTFSIGTSESDVHIGTKSYLGGNIFDGDIPIAPNTEGIII